ncbi:MAG: TlpA family protein disulfide reductase, partial [Phycisphaerales bacterium]|nr:TlpA family protein disulfide reductase [Phycisphaerales bacterium]
HTATVLNFVAANGGYCKRQIPQVEKVRQAYEAKGVRFVNMAQTMRQEFSPEELTKVMNSLGSKIELAKDDDNAIGRGKFLVRGFPTLFVVGKDGVVQEVIIGARADLEETLNKQLETLTSQGSGS